MPLVKVKEKYQVTLPSSVREKVGLSVGDLLEAEVKGSTITLTPKSIVDRDIAVSLQEMKKGQLSPVFRSSKAAVRYLHRQAKKLSQAK